MNKKWKINLIKILETKINSIDYKKNNLNKFQIFSKIKWQKLMFQKYAQ